MSQLLLFKPVNNLRWSATNLQRKGKRGKGKIDFNNLYIVGLMGCT